MSIPGQTAGCRPSGCPSSPHDRTRHYFVAPCKALGNVTGMLGRAFAGAGLVVYRVSRALGTS